jgi:hypothetical protein
MDNFSYTYKLNSNDLVRLTNCTTGTTQTYAVVDNQSYQKYKPDKIAQTGWSKTINSPNIFPMQVEELLLGCLNIK